MGVLSKPQVGKVRLLLAQNVGITGIQNSHDGAAEELTAGGAHFDLYKY